MADAGDEVPRLAAVVESQRRELVALRGAAAVAGVVAMARGVLMERHGYPAGEAARQLDGMAAAAGLPLPEMAAAVLGQPPPGHSDQWRPAAAVGSGPAADPVTVAEAEAARDGAELIEVLAGQVLPRAGASAIAVWLLEPDGALGMLGEAGLDGTVSSRWRRLPPQFRCPQQRAVLTGQALWWHAGPPDDSEAVTSPWGRAAARAVLPLRDGAGVLLGVLQVWWQTPQDEWDAETRSWMSAVADGFADVLGLRAAQGLLGSAGKSPAILAALDAMTESVLIARPQRDAGGALADFAITHLSPHFTDPAGRPAAELRRQTLLTAYPQSTSPGGLFDRAARVLAVGRAEEVPGRVPAPLTGASDAIPVADLRAVPFFDGVVLSWRSIGTAELSADLLNHAERLARIGGWEENLATGSVRWSESAFALFGLDPAHAVPIPTQSLQSFVIAADRGTVRRFRQSLVHRRDAAVAVFRIVRPGDTVLRQIRIFAEPVVVGGEVVALRGAFQDVSAHYHTQVALAATQDQLADSEQRAAQEQLLALRLQRAIMPEDEPPPEAAGVDVAVRYRPAEEGRLVAGDWYDALLLPSKELLLVVGDITGHGIDAVTGMVAARNALRGLAATGAGPADLLRHLNYASCHLTEGIAGTVVCGMYHPDTRVLRWARAGHLPPVLVRDGAAEALPLPDGVLLGLDPEAEYEEATLQLRDGDTLLLFTDGLIERRTGSISDALGEFAAAAVPAGPDAAAHADRILGGAISDTGDDACLVAVRIR